MPRSFSWLCGIPLEGCVVFINSLSRSRSHKQRHSSSDHIFHFTLWGHWWCEFSEETSGQRTVYSSLGWTPTSRPLERLLPSVLNQQMGGPIRPHSGHGPGFFPANFRFSQFYHAWPFFQINGGNAQCCPRLCFTLTIGKRKETRPKPVAQGKGTLLLASQMWRSGTAPPLVDLVRLLCVYSRLPSLW